MKKMLLPIILFYTLSLCLAKENKDEIQVELILFKNNEQQNIHKNYSEFFHNAHTNADYYLYSSYLDSNELLLLKNSIDFVENYNIFIQKNKIEDVLFTRIPFELEKNHISKEKIIILNKLHRMANIAKKITANNNEVIAHLSWDQPINQNGTSSIDINNNGNIYNNNSNLTVKGVIDFKRANGFKVWLDLLLNDYGNFSEINDSRWMKKNELNYIDHREYGILIMLS